MLMSCHSCLETCKWGHKSNVALLSGLLDGERATPPPFPPPSLIVSPLSSLISSSSSVPPPPPSNPRSSSRSSTGAALIVFGRSAGGAVFSTICSPPASLGQLAFKGGVKRPSRLSEAQSCRCWTRPTARQDRSRAGEEEEEEEDGEEEDAL